MLSDSAYDQIKNRGDVSVVALGRFRLKKVGRPFELYAVVSDGLVVLEPAAFADSFGAFRSSDGSACRLLKLFQCRECGRLAGGCELLGTVLPRLRPVATPRLHNCP